jgi:exodeoxyribonuclease V gamma subunit
LTAWVRHLVWNAAQPGGKTVVIGWDKKKKQSEQTTLRPPRQPEALLSQLLALYWRGLSEPLRLFPKTSYAFAEKDRAGKPGLEAALKQWEGDDRYGRGEGTDEYCALFFRHELPLNDVFEMLATSVFGPLLEHQEEVE